jgi:hypothetical protein
MSAGMPVTSGVGFWVRAWIGISCATACAGYLLYESLQRNQQRSCVVRDTPYLSLCPDATSESFRNRVAELQARIAASPGESRAYAELAYLASGDPAQATAAGLPSESVLQSAVLLAPNDRDVLRMQAELAISKKDWANGVRWLVQLADQHVDYSAARVLGRLVAQGMGTDLLMGYVNKGSGWLPRMMETMAQSGLPASTALPLVMKGYAQGVLTPAMLQPIMKSMKVAGHWADAYALWVHQHGKPVDLVYNADFERAFRSNGFDWEIGSTGSGRAGAEVQRVRLPEKGFALSVQYTGRVIAAPPVRQQLFLYGGRYRMRVQYMTEKLRSEDGLAWVVACESPKTTFGRSSPIKNTSGAWQQLVFDFEVPASCRTVVNLQLETYSAFEATAGLTGRAYFDGVTIERLGQNLP